MSSRRLYEPTATPISDRESGLSGYDEDLERDESEIARDQDKQETRRSSIKKNKSRRAKKNEKTKSKKTKSKKYVMISTTMDDEGDGDHSDTDSSDEDEEQSPAKQTNSKRKSNAGHTTTTTTTANKNGCTSLQNVDCEFEEIKLTSSISPNNLVDIDIDGNDEEEEDKHLNGHRRRLSTANGTQSTMHPSKEHELHSKYGVSAYYGARLDYRTKKCHDVGWCIAWVLHCVAIGVVLVVVWTHPNVHMPHASGGVFLLSFLLAFAVIFACICTFLLKYCGGFTIWILIIGNHIFLAAFASFCFIVGDRFFGIGIIFTILFVVFGVFTLFIRDRISYTIALVQLGHSILVTSSSAFGVSFGVLILQIAWLFVWGSIVVAFAAQYQHTNSSSGFWGIILILTLSFIWTHQVIKNIGHCVVSAVIAHWYFTPSSSRNASSPTCAALCRSLTTSLGSIVYGSLFINVLQALSSYTRALRDGCGGIQCCRYCLTCCLSACDGLLEYFNHYAFVHVAVYNTAYLRAGKQTFDLLTMAKIHQLMNANYTEYALLCGSICGGVMNSILASYVSNVMNFSTDWVVLFTCGGLLIGMSLSSTLLNAVSSCIMALFVLYAEEPSLLNELHPEQALRFDGAKQGIV